MRLSSALIMGITWSAMMAARSFIHTKLDRSLHQEMCAAGAGAACSGALKIVELLLDVSKYLVTVFAVLGDGCRSVTFRERE